MKIFYLIFAIIGLLLPYSELLPFLIESGFDLPLLLDLLFANRISAFFGWDVVVSAIVLVPFIIHESNRIEMRSYWLPIGGTLLVGVSFGLPLFLFLREHHLDRGKVQPQG